jgi:DNA-directed RNA polymerase specialized sigma54-like protein
MEVQKVRNKVSGLSLQEFRFLLANGYEGSGNREVTLEIPREFYLGVPEIDILKEGDGFSAKCSNMPRLCISVLLDRCRQERGWKSGRLERTFYNEMVPSARLQERQQSQEAIMKWVAGQQGEYLLTRDPRWLRDITEGDICREFGWDSTKVCRLVKNLSVKLPGSAESPRGKVVFAKELFPGESRTTYIGMYMVEQLRNNPEFYSSGEWKASDQKMSDYLNGLGIANRRRSFTEYRRKLDRYLAQGYF